MSDHPITAPSTIKLDLFLAVLEHRNSPVFMLGTEAYAICERWDVDPAVALAFFVHESGAGTQGAAVQTRNWGNLRIGPGELDGAGIKLYAGFASYASWLVGLNDWCKLLRGPLYEGSGLTTVSKVTPRYAPSADANDPQAYAEAVNAMVEEWKALSA